METKESKGTKPAVAAKPKTSAKPAKKKEGFKGIKAASLVILICFIIALCIYNFVLGNPNNFQGGSTENSAANLAGTVYKGGVIVPLIHTLLLTVIALSIERWLALRTAFGKMSLYKFVQGVRACLTKNDLDGVRKLCDQQGGTVANVVLATLAKYKEVDEDTTGMSKDQKVIAIQKELDEATALEMPALQQNLPILATLTTLGVLFGLMGTVFGMIRSFSALAAGGGADSAALSQGISEALINTFFGIVTSALAVITYNYFSNRIDQLTYSLDEVGFTLIQNFSATH